MLSEILEAKSAFLATSGSHIKDSSTFLIELKKFNWLPYSLATSDSYWSSYIHATLASAFFICTEYSLVHWNTYMQTISVDSATILGINPVLKESDVFEYLVLHTINYVFGVKQSSLQIIAVRANDNKNPTSLLDDSQKMAFSQVDNDRIMSNLRVVMKVRGLPEKRIWGDNDVIVTMNFNNVVQQFCIISCKLSLRERVYQSIFWAMHSRLEGVGKHVFVTTDKGNGNNKLSEIGMRGPSPDFMAKKSRDVLESTMDRVYVFREAHEVNRSQVITDFPNLKIDLENWAAEIAGH